MKRRPRPDGQDLEPLVRELRGSLANLRSAAEALDVLAPAGEVAEAVGLRAVVLTEAERLTGLVDRLGTVLQPFELPAGGGLPAAALLATLARAARDDLHLELDAEAAPAGVRLAGAATLIAPLVATLGRLRNDFAVEKVTLRARLHQDLLALDLSWPASEPDLWRLREANAELLAGPGPGEAPLRDIVQGLGGEVWLTVDRTAASASLRLLLPQAGAAGG